MTVADMETIWFCNHSFTFSTTTADDDIIRTQIKTLKRKRSECESQFMTFLEKRYFLDETGGDITSSKKRISLLPKNTGEYISSREYLE